MKKEREGGCVYMHMPKRLLASCCPPLSTTYLLTSYLHTHHTHRFCCCCCCCKICILVVHISFTSTKSPSSETRHETPSSSPHTHIYVIMEDPTRPSHKKTYQLKGPPESHLVTTTCDAVNQDLNSLISKTSKSSKTSKTSEIRKSLAIFPGSFNPPTRVHVEIVQRVLEMGDVEALWVDMTVHRTKKTRIAEVLSHRTRMARSAVREIRNAGVTTLMSQLGDDGWGSEYFQILRQVSGGCPITWVMGSDVARDMKFWKTKARECISMCCRVVVFTRSHDEKQIKDMIRDVMKCDDKKESSSKTEVIVMKLSKDSESISSTKIRNSLIELAKITQSSSLSSSSTSSTTSLLLKIFSKEKEEELLLNSTALRLIKELRRTTPESVLRYIAKCPDLISFYESSLSTSPH